MQDFLSVTELAGDEVSQEQIDRICNRYYWAKNFCQDKDIVEVACGTGQGLGFLKKYAKSLEAGDYSEEILAIARKHYQERVKLSQFDALDMPFADNSKDVIILFEAIYYLPDAKKFIQECGRVLRPGGKILIATANKDLYDFNPSPHSFQYYGVKELHELMRSCRFSCKCYGYLSVETIGVRQRILRPIKKIVVNLGLMPKSMAGKKLLKRLIFGNLVKMPAEIKDGMTGYTQPTPLAAGQADRKFKVIYCEATLKEK